MEKKVNDKEPEAQAPTPSQPRIDLQQYECERCGFKYQKVFDYPPFLCYKCMRFVAKRTVTTVKQLVPTSYPKISSGNV